MLQSLTYQCNTFAELHAFVQLIQPTNTADINNDNCAHNLY